MNQTPKTVRELGIMMTARDDVLNERLSSINDNVSRLAESVKQLAESKADAEEPESLDSPRGTDARQLFVQE